MNQESKAIKCVVWDLDNTLWDGILSESNNVTLKPGVMDIIETLDARGILQSIASKNNYDDAEKKLKEFGLDSFFLYPEIHWDAKSKSIERIRKNLNFSMDAMLFIDDQPFERDEVKNEHPDVTCIDAADYQGMLDEPYLNPRFITSDSAKRRQMYQEDIKRNIEEESFEGPSESFLASLDMEFDIALAQEVDLKRAEELTVRTHQLNATGITYDYDELNELRQSDQHRLYICELRDKYGSYGKIGLALVELSEKYWHLRLMLMSCRVMSRGVGSVLLSYIMEQTKADGKKLLADFKKTDRNRPMLVSYKFQNFTEKSSDTQGNILFENDLTEIQAYPPYIKLSAHGSYPN